MKRRSFVRNNFLAAGALVFSAAPCSGKAFKPFAGKPFRLDYAPHDGMFSASAGKIFTNQIRYMHTLGFRSVEDNGMTDRPASEQTQIGNLIEKLEMRMGVFVLPKGGNGAHTLAAGKKEHVSIFLKGCRTAVETAKRCHARWVTVVPGNYERSLPIDIQTANVVDALRRGAEILEKHGIVMVLEPLSDTPDLFLRYAAQTYQICKAVNSNSCKILFDVYHIQKNEGNLIKNIERCWDEIAYLQVGDNPGRKEPTTGEINYKNVFKYISGKNYRGIIGMEHGVSLPGTEGESRLVQAYREVDRF